MTTEEIMQAAACVDIVEILPGNIPDELWEAFRFDAANNNRERFAKLMRDIISDDREAIRRAIIRHFATDGSLAQRFGIIKGQCFRWQGKGEEIIWSIEACKEIIGDSQPQVEMRPEHWQLALDSNSLAHEINRDYATTQCDFDEPLIAVASPEPNDPPGAMILVDGWHRILGAILTGRTKPMMVHLLTREEEMQCRIKAV